MNGIHDLGGMHGFGAVVVERDEPVFHAGWEKRVFGAAAWRLSSSHTAFSGSYAVVGRSAV